MRLSKWNSYINIEGDAGLIYNSFSDKFILVKPKSKDLAYAKRGDIEKFSPLFAKQMQLSGGLVEESLDETSEIDKIISSVDLDKNVFHIIINPTLDCNFKCWYCYENHVQNSCMSDDVLIGLIALINKRLQKYQETNNCQISFFGGEPLLKYNEIIKPIIIKVYQICLQHNINLSLQFTTNAFLINEEMINFLKPYKVSFQITLDGGKNDHDKIRFGKGNIPTYGIILKNIEKLADNEFDITLRINYTSKNIKSCSHILNDLNKFKSKSRQHIVIDFQRVWQDKPYSHEDDADLIARQLRIALHSMKFHTANNRLTSSIKNPCYADNINELLVNYNGDIFFCTARDFNSENRAGKLNKYGEIEWIGNSYSQRMSCKFRKEVCRSCRIAPICGGGCRTKCLEASHHNDCNLGYSEEDIDNLILDRFIDRYITK